MSWRSSGHGDEVVSEHRTTGWDDVTANEVVRDGAGVAGNGPETDRADTGMSRRRKGRAGFASVVAVAAVVLFALAAALASSFLPASSGLKGDTIAVAASVIFVTSYLALAVGRVPGLSIDRAGIALVGACLMVASGALPLEDAYKAIDFNTITLLLGMMIVVANLRLSGFFALANAWVARRAQRPLVLLIAITAVAGVFSAFLVNDAICLVLAPLVLELTLGTGRKPMPYLLALAMGSNIGSTATITGNPQNMMIGSFSQMPYASFAAVLAPVAAVGLVLTVALIVVAHRGEFPSDVKLTEKTSDVRVNRVLAWRAVLATGVLVALFFAGQPPAKAAIVIGGLLLLTRRVKSERIYAEIDWSLLLMFVGLFIIVAGAQHVLLTQDVVVAVGRLRLDEVPILTAVTAVLSNLVSNVPAVLVLRPFVESLKNHNTAWLVVAMASTLAGNFTIVGSIANLIVVQKAAQRGINIGFWDHFRVGAPLTVLTLVIGTLWVWQ